MLHNVKYLFPFQKKKAELICQENKINLHGQSARHA